MEVSAALLSPRTQAHLGPFSWASLYKLSGTFFLKFLSAMVYSTIWFILLCMCSLLLFLFSSWICFIYPLVVVQVKIVFGITKSNGNQLHTDAGETASVLISTESVLEVRTKLSPFLLLLYWGRIFGPFQVVFSGYSWLGAWGSLLMEHEDHKVPWIKP